MISYEIQKKRPPSPMGLIDRIKSNLLAKNDENTGVTPPVLGPSKSLNGQPIVDPEPVWHAMGKHQYASYLNTHVYPMFPVGTLVTIKPVGITLGAPPSVWFKVMLIQEIHYMAQMDRERKEPKCVGLAVQGDKPGTIPVWYPVSALRLLVQSEIEAIDRLRNQAKSTVSSDPDIQVGDSGVILGGQEIAKTQTT